MAYDLRTHKRGTPTTNRAASATRTILCLLLTAVLFMCAPLNVMAASTYEGEGFESPEAAVQAYLTGMQNEDLSQMLSAFAIETLVERYDLEAMLGQIRAYTYSLSIKLPNSNAIFESINIEARKGEIMGAIQWQLLSFHMPELDFTQTIAFADDDAEEAIAAFIETFDANTRPLAMKELQLDAFIEPETLSELYLNEQNQRNIAKRAPVYGADEIKSVAASLSVDGTPYILCCDAIRYGDSWYLHSLGGNIAQLLGMNVFSGGLMPFQF